MGAIKYSVKSVAGHKLIMRIMAAKAGVKSRNPQFLNDDDGWGWGWEWG